MKNTKAKKRNTGTMPARSAIIEFVSVIMVLCLLLWASFSIWAWASK